MTVLEKYNLAVDLVEGDDSLYSGYLSEVESYVPVVVDLMSVYSEVVSLLSGVSKKRINLYYFNGELVANVGSLGIMLSELVVNRESCLSMLDEVYNYCLPALRFEVKILSNDVDSFVSIMKRLKDLRFSVDSGVVVPVVIEEPVVASVGVVDGEEIEASEIESEIVEVKKKK